MPGPIRHALTLTLLATALVLGADTLATAQKPDAAPQPGPTDTVLRTGTQLVIVDVVVQDKDGHPIHGLKREDFILSESKAPQSIRDFEPHTTDQPAKPGPELPKMPAGTFTNYTPVSPSGTLNVLLLDALNTPMKDQAYVRYELQQYVKKDDPGTRIAIFGLNSRLFLLQGFTSDPATLKEAVEHKLTPRASHLLDDPVGTDADTNSLSQMASDMGNTTVAANLAQFEAEQAAFQTEMRTQYTLDAFNDIAHYLSNFPGRKNLIWFSGSFPLDLLPDPDIQSPFNVMYINDEEFQETTNLLARAQVAVYPVDARGLMTNPVFSAANSGHGYARNPQAFSKAIGKFDASQAAEHTTMEMMADATGGHAYYNTNDLADAVSKALNAGSNYYTLTYTPTNRKWDGGYRPIKVELTGAAAARGLKLTYRHGYYANDPDSRKKGVESATVSSADATAAHAADAYRRNAISHGAPTPEDIVFKVRAIPATKELEAAVAPTNVTSPTKPLKGPFHRFQIDYVALPSDFQMTATPKGNHTGAIEFSAYLYDPDGNLLNATGSTVQLDLPPDSYTQFRRNPIRYRIDISAPVKGETYLRIVIHDVAANHFGAIEFPVSEISRLDPVSATPMATSPSANPATPAPALSTPATTSTPAPAAQAPAQTPARSPAQLPTTGAPAPTAAPH
jgi:VWFA-related protein